MPFLGIYSKSLTWTPSHKLLSLSSEIAIFFACHPIDKTPTPTSNIKEDTIKCQLILKIFFPHLLAQDRHLPHLLEELGVDLPPFIVPPSELV